MRRAISAALVGVALMLAAAAPVAAASAPGPGCSVFGVAQTAAIAPGGGLAQLIQSVVHLGPGTLSGIVQDEHAQYCASH